MIAYSAYLLTEQSECKKEVGRPLPPHPVHRQTGVNRVFTLYLVVHGGKQPVIYFTTKTSKRLSTTA